MTDRLYYTDPYLRAFDATIDRVEERDGRVRRPLDRTAFYPTSGGQPFDTGLLGGSRVVDVVDEDDGRSCTSSSTTGMLRNQRGEAVHGEIDWARRFDHMQQHTGQHVLSAAFDRLFGVRTVSFHLGAAASTIDLARELSPAEIAAAETEANRIVWEDRPVAIRFASAEEAAAMPLRKEAGARRDAAADRRRRLRPVGLRRHARGANGRHRRHRRRVVGALQGRPPPHVPVRRPRARGISRRFATPSTGSVQRLSVLPEELPGAIDRLQADAKEQKRSLGALQIELARYRADELALSAEEVTLKPEASGGAAEVCRLVARAVDADANGLKALATAIAAKPGYIVVLVSTSAPSLAVVARSADVNVPAQRLLSSLHSAFGGRGGGKADFAQGGGLGGSPEAVLAAAHNLITSQP